MGDYVVIAIDSVAHDPIKVYGSLSKKEANRLKAKLSQNIYHVYVRKLRIVRI